MSNKKRLCTVAITILALVMASGPVQTVFAGPYADPNGAAQKTSANQNASTAPLLEPTVVEQVDAPDIAFAIMPKVGPYIEGRDGAAYYFRTTFSQPELEALRKLTAAEAERFQQQRYNFLSYIYRVFQSKKLFFGLGSFTKSKLFMLVPERFRGQSFQLQNANGTRADQKINAILDWIDRSICLNPKVTHDTGRAIKEANDFSVAVTVGGNLTAMRGKIGLGGIVNPLVFTFGWNKLFQTFVFEISSTATHVRRAAGVEGQLRAGLGVSFNAKNRDTMETPAFTRSDSQGRRFSIPFAGSVAVTDDSAVSVSPAFIPSFGVGEGWAGLASTLLGALPHAANLVSGAANALSSGRFHTSDFGVNILAINVSPVFPYFKASIPTWGLAIHSAHEMWTRWYNDVTRKSWNSHDNIARETNVVAARTVAIVDERMSPKPHAPAFVGRCRELFGSGPIFGYASAR